MSDPSLIETTSRAPSFRSPESMICATSTQFVPQQPRFGSICVVIPRPHALRPEPQYQFSRRDDAMRKIAAFVTSLSLGMVLAAGAPAMAQDAPADAQIGNAHVGPPVINAQIVDPLPLEQD